MKPDGVRPGHPARGLPPPALSWRDEAETEEGFGGAAFLVGEAPDRGRHAARGSPAP
jgi:hypothetical protein